MDFQYDRDVSVTLAFHVMLTYQSCAMIAELC